jgi:hypothetical protein
VARHAYKSEKRRKETTRLKKQEEKRQRRFGAKTNEDGTEIETIGTEDGVEGAVEGTEVASGEENTEAKEGGLPQGA